MEVPLLKTYEATPAPKLVVAVGDCAKHCGVFKGSYAVMGSVADVIPVDAFVTGCPPEPAEILQGILAALGRLPQKNELICQVSRLASWKLSLSRCSRPMSRRARRTGRRSEVVGAQVGCAGCGCRSRRGSGARGNGDCHGRSVRALLSRTFALGRRSRPAA
jgi:coenzyme F420-reducing hydrogenase gamma subunit